MPESDEINMSGESECIYISDVVGISKMRYRIGNDKNCNSNNELISKSIEIPLFVRNYSKYFDKIFSENPTHIKLERQFRSTVKN
jgi:hypothetical protein